MNKLLNDYYSGGYFLLRVEQNEQRSLIAFLEIEKPPEKIISLSRCICLILPVAAWGTPSFKEFERNKALSFGIPENKLDDYIVWSETEYKSDNVDMYSVFDSTDVARRCANLFLPDRDNLYLIGIGLPKECEESTWCEEGESISVKKRIEQHLPLETGGTLLGFEIVSYNSWDFGHSWWCSGLPKYIYDRFGIRYNSYGLLDSYDDAKKVYKCLLENENLGEPEPYDFWLIISYPL